MTDQSVRAAIGNSMLAKQFTKGNAQDGRWDGNTLTDSLSSQQIGILMPSVVIDRVQAQYTAGACAWRIQNSATLAFQRFGFGVGGTISCWESSAIAPYRVGANDIFTVYPLAVNTLPNHTDSLAWVVTSKGVELFASQSLDAVPTDMTTVVNGQSLGDSMFNSTIQSIHIQCEDAAVLDRVEIIDNNGGTVWTAYGGNRGLMLGKNSNQYNLKVDGLAFPVGKGFSLKVTTISG